MLIFLSKVKISSDELIKKCVEEFCRIFNKPIPTYSIIRKEGEKPVLQPQFLHFSLSHSGDYKALAISQEVIGIDIQQRKTLDYMAVSERFFERQVTDSKDFFDDWTAKEAYAKCSGEPLVEVMKKTICGVTTLDILEGYSLAIKSEDKEILFVFLF